VTSSEEDSRAKPEIDSLPGLLDDSDADSDDESISALKDDSDSDDETGVTIRHGRRRLPWRSKVYSLNRSFQGAAIRDAVTHTAAPVPDDTDHSAVMLTKPEFMLRKESLLLVFWLIIFQVHQFSALCSLWGLMRLLLSLSV